MREAIVFLALLASTGFVGDDPAKDAPPRNELWAAISISHPLRDLDSFTTDRFSLRFSLANDGSKKVNPEIEAAVLIVNGKELKETREEGATIEISDESWNSLPPGDYLSFSRDVGKIFNKPGTYKVIWKGKTFQSPEIVFRVVGKRGNKP